MLNFAMTGVAGYIAPSHLEAIHAVGGKLLAALDPHDSVGVLDRYFPDCRFFTEFERFDRHLDKRRRLPPEEQIHYLSICSPNYLHDAHIRYGLRLGANVICEKPLVIFPHNLDGIAHLEKETGRKTSVVLQLRHHPNVQELKKTITASQKKHVVELTYVTPRGSWYLHSWKGDPERSGGLAMNIGVHLFDLLVWLFGGITRCEVHHSEPTRMSGYLELEQAAVSWFLSVNASDLPEPEKGGSFRTLTLDGNPVVLTDGFTKLHTETYRKILAGEGFGVNDVRASLDLVDRIRKSIPGVTRASELHPLIRKLKR